MPQILSKDEVVEAIVEFVRAHFELQDRKEKSETHSLVFSGVREEKTPKGKKVVKRYALDVVTKIDSSTHPIIWKRRVKYRSESKNRIYTGMILPRSLNYNKADSIFVGPYLRTANLLDGLDEELFERFKDDFLKDSVFILSDLETEVVIPLMGNFVSYYNPKKNAIQSMSFRAFPEWQIIPFNRNTPDCTLVEYDEKYLRTYVSIPDPSLSYAKKKFFQKQQHLHRVVRTMIKKNEIDGDFTLKSHKNPKCKFYGARLNSLNQKP